MWSEKRIVRSLIAAHLLLGALCTALIYGISAGNDTLDSDAFYPSHEMAGDPQRVVGAFILPFLGATSAIFVGLRLRRMQPLLAKNSKRPVAGHHLFGVCVVLLVLATISAVGVGAVSLDISVVGHYVFAGIMFGSVGFMLVFLAVLDDWIKLQRPKWLRVGRIIASSLALVLALIMLGVPDDTVFSAIELTVIANFSAHLASFAHSSEFPMRPEEAGPIQANLVQSQSSIVQTIPKFSVIEQEGGKFKVQAN